MTLACWAHDLPMDLLVETWVKPEASMLRVVVRVPLVAMRDIEFPLEGPGYLDAERAKPLLGEAAQVWVAGSLDFYENGRKLAGPQLAGTRLALAADRSFSSFEHAVARFAEQPRLETRVIPSQALFDVLLEYPIQSPKSEFAMESRLARLGLRSMTTVRYVGPDSPVRAFEWSGDQGIVRLDPSFWYAARRFTMLGFEHIISGIDHLLFLAALVIPNRKLRVLIPVVTAFTLAHSITLIASALGYGPDALWFPPLVETLIAASIVYVAAANILGLAGDRWFLAFAFGLVHGFGFSFALKETLQFAGAHLVSSLAAFNIGVELGQILAVALMAPALNWIAQRAGSAERERWLMILISAVVAHSGWHWMTERGAALFAFPFAWPVFDPAFAAQVFRMLLAAAILVGIAAAFRYLVEWVLARTTASERPASSAADPGP